MRMIFKKRFFFFGKSIFETISIDIISHISIHVVTMFLRCTISIKHYDEKIIVVLSFII